MGNLSDSLKRYNLIDDPNDYLFVSFTQKCYLRVWLILFSLNWILNSMGLEGHLAGEPWRCSAPVQLSWLSWPWDLDSIPYQPVVPGRDTALKIRACKGKSRDKRILMLVPWVCFTFILFFSSFSFFHDYSLVLVDGILQTTFHPPLINPGWIKRIQLLHDWLWILFRSFSDNSSSAL